MSITIMTSLLLIAGSTPLLDPGDRIQIDANRPSWQAPQLPEWPADLPPLYVTPQDAVIFAAPLGFELGDGVWLPRERSDFQDRILTLAMDMPDLVQRQLDRLRLIEVPALVDAELSRHLAAARARWLRDRDGEVQGSFQDWFVGFMVIGAAVVGALIGAGAYAIMR